MLTELLATSINNRDEYVITQNTIWNKKEIQAQNALDLFFFTEKCQCKKFPSIEITE